VKEVRAIIANASLQPFPSKLLTQKLVDLKGFQVLE
jgi:hypothetical protein